jgi:hypothetical protein
VRIVVASASITYTASKDTYLDITPLGVTTYTAVANGATAPALATNNLRVAKIVSSATAITSVTMIAKYRELYAIAVTNIEASPGNYFRNTAAPEEITIEGKEFVISKSVLDLVYYPAIKKGDRIKDTEIGTMIVTEVREMFGFGGAIIGYRVRTS